MNRKVLLGGVAILAILLLLFIPKAKKGQQAIRGSSSTSAEAKKLYEQAQAYKASRKVLEAKEIYHKILTEHSDIDNMQDIQKELEVLNMEIIHSNVPTPHTVIHEVKTGDTLGKLASKYNTTIDLIKTSNKLRSDIIRIGQKLRIWKGKFNLFVDKSQNILILRSDNEVIKVYRVSTGENNSTPIGKFKVVSKLVDPVWFNRGVIVPPESPANVLGSRWLGFDIPGYGIHGTIEPETIGQQITAGCVRMTNHDVEELYSLIPRGTEVVIED